MTILSAINDVTFYLEKEAFLDMSLAIIECQVSCYATYDSFKEPRCAYENGKRQNLVFSKAHLETGCLNLS